ncbi:MAG: ParA family protein [Chloroflexi bacterium]|nr:ParA family protein [Chloroflexota bacterium]
MELLVNIAVLNNKGGSGKTTTVVNLAGALVEQGKPVTIVDLCPQGDAGTCLGLGEYDGLYPFDVKVQPIEVKPGLRIIPAHYGRLMEYEDGGEGPLFLGYLEKGETIIIDCPPQIMRLAAAAVAASDNVIVPLAPSYLSYQGLQAVGTFIDSLKGSGVLVRKKPPIWTLVNQVRVRYSLDRSALSFINDSDHHHLTTYIPLYAHIARAVSAGTDVIEYAPNSRAADVFRELAKEVISNGLA